MEKEETTPDGQVKIYNWSYEDDDYREKSMISAKEAREKANKVKSDEHDIIIRQIDAQITSDCGNGDTYLRWEGEMPASVEDVLKSKGYKVESVSGGFSGDSYYAIYW